MSEIKAELVYTQRHSDGFYPTCYPSDRRDMAISTDTPHRIIAEADLPTGEEIVDTLRNESPVKTEGEVREIVRSVRVVLAQMGLCREGE